MQIHEPECTRFAVGSCNGRLSSSQPLRRDQTSGTALEHPLLASDRVPWTKGPLLFVGNHLIGGNPKRGAAHGHGENGSPTIDPLVEELHQDLYGFIRCYRSTYPLQPVWITI